MLSSGDVVEVDLAVPVGSEAGLRRPAVVVTAQRVLRAEPAVIQVVPLTRTLRGYATEVIIPANDVSGRDADTAAQCRHIRAVATARVVQPAGNVGVVALAQIGATLAALLDR
jgi:mRNA interferase MazF